jgi:hypothetical protein
MRKPSATGYGDGGRDRGMPSGDGTAILPFRRRASSNSTYVAFYDGCGAPVAVAWHRYCRTCYAGGMLYRAIARYRGVKP